MDDVVYVTFSCERYIIIPLLVEIAKENRLSYFRNVFDIYSPPTPRKLRPLLTQPFQAFFFSVSFGSNTASEIVPSWNMMSTKRLLSALSYESIAINNMLSVLLLLLLLLCIAFALLSLLVPSVTNTHT